MSEQLLERKARKGRSAERLLELSHTALVLKTKWKIASNAVRNIRKHLYVHLAVGIFLVFFLVGGGAAVFWRPLDGPIDQHGAAGLLFDVAVFELDYHTFNNVYIARGGVLDGAPHEPTIHFSPETGRIDYL